MRCITTAWIDAVGTAGIRVCDLGAGGGAIISRRFGRRLCACAGQLAVSGAALRAADRGPSYE